MLPELQKQLEERFAGLAALRRELNYPVYAIEHGIDELTLLNARAEAGRHLRSQPPFPQHWLVWVALAAEGGYAYSGDEFWGPLETSPGEWLSIERRRTLRSFYEKFHALYSGPKPVGRWAQHFNIISWPISNAILPRYLQSLFARHLYDLRFELAHRIAADGVGTGQFLLDQYATGHSQRFRDFLQQTDLTTQIVFALRDEHLEGIVQRIDPNALHRIVGDLERQQLARSYLRDARKVIQSATVRIAANLRSGGSGSTSTATGAAAPQSRTHLLARRQGDGTFLLGFRLPDIRAILKAGGFQRAALANARVRFVGRADRPEPADALFALGGKEGRLDSFPPSSAGLFTLDNAVPELRALLDPAARIEESRVWLLRRQADGQYREMLGGQVRTNQDYLLLSRQELPAATLQDTGIASVVTIPADVFAYRLKTPAHMSGSQVAALGMLGIGATTGIAIDAVGISPAASLDNNRIPAWTSAETVTLRLRADVKATAFRITLDGGAPATFNCAEGTALIEFEPFEPGLHEVSVSLISQDGRATTPEILAFEITSPRPWPQAMRERAGFRLSLQPTDATFEQLSVGAATLHVVGPPGRTVHWSIELYDIAGQFSESLRVGDAKVGAAENVLHSMLDKALRENAAKIDDAPRLDIVASLDELGRQAQSLPHPVNALRWKFEPSKGIVRLVDETDHSQPLNVRTYPFSTPVARQAVELSVAHQGVAVQPPGALFEAISGNERALLYVSPPRGGVLHGLADLGEVQVLEPSSERAATLIKLIDALRRWRRANAVGQLAPLRKQATIKWIGEQIDDLVCGQDFAKELRSSRPNSLERAQKSVGGSAGFGFRMRTFARQNQASAARQLTASAVLYEIDGAEKWGPVAVALAFGPTTIRVPDGEDKAAYFEELLSKRSLLRGAFLARTASMSAGDDRIRETA